MVRAIVQPAGFQFARLRVQLDVKSGNLLLRARSWARGWRYRGPVAAGRGLAFGFAAGQPADCAAAAVETLLGRLSLATGNLARARVEIKFTDG
eukprot:6796292-Lingulodinium_polyedra.AAC.1